LAFSLEKINDFVIFFSFKVNHCFFSRKKCGFQALLLSILLPAAFIKAGIFTAFFKYSTAMLTASEHKSKTKNISTGYLKK
jgi:hypothetical protein